MAKDLVIRDFDTLVPKMLQAFVFVITAAVVVDAFLSVTRSSLITQYIQSQMYLGVTDPRECEVDDKGSFLDLINDSPFVPWVSAQFINDGPNSVWVAVNNPDAKFEIKANESATVNRIGAVDRILSIYFICATGKTAIVRVIGEY